jgi:hypothetical protein
VFDEDGWVLPDGLLNNIECWLLLSPPPPLPPLEGGTESGKFEGLAASAGFADAPVLGTAPKLNEAATGVGPGLSAGFANVNEAAAADPALVGPGAEADAASGGAPNPTDLGSDEGADAFFCSSNLALIFAMASASRSCFSHFEKVLKPPLRIGLSLIPVPV